MHTIKLIRLSWQNLLSYGSNINEVSLENDGITWIKGPNGSGKSTIIEAITVALFGEPYRKITKKDLINSANKGKMVVKLIFDRIDNKGTVRYCVKRELSKSGSMSCTLSILSADEIEESMPSGITQKFIEDDILGFNKNIFENVISMNTIQTKPFIDMTPEDKRKLIESIISLQIEKIKKLNTSNTTYIYSKLSETTNDIIKYDLKIKELEETKNRLLFEQKEDINQLELDLKQLNETYNTLVDKIKFLDVEENKIIQLYNEKKSKYNEYENLTEMMQLLTEYKVILNSDDGLSEIKNFEETISDNEKNISNICIEIEKINETINNVLKIYNCISFDDLLKIKENIVNEVSYKKALIEKCLDELNHIKAENDGLKIGVPCALCKKLSTEEDINKIRNSLREKWVEVNNNKKKLENEVNTILNNLSIIDENIKQVKILYDVLNKKNNEVSYCNHIINQTKKSIDNILNKSVYKKNRLNELKIKLGNPIDLDVYENDLNKKMEIKKEIELILNEYINKINLIKNEKNILIHNKNDLIEKIDMVNKRIEKRKNIEGSAIEINEKQLLQAKEALNNLNNNITTLSDKLEITKFLDIMFGDEGIKKFILGLFVPTLNQVIAHNISLFSLPFVIEFDDSLNYTFISKFGMAQVYKALSQGQQRKLNFCISMAFRDFVALIADFKINIMFLDEVLDISTDDEGLRDMVKLIKQKNKKDIPSIYLMSHRGEQFEEEWDHIIEVTLDGSYSKLRQIK